MRREARECLERAQRELLAAEAMVGGDDPAAAALDNAMVAVAHALQVSAEEMLLRQKDGGKKMEEIANSQLPNIQ